MHSPSNPISTAVSPDSNECICKILRRGARSVTNLYDKSLAPSGLRTTQFTILSVLARQSAASVTQLSEVLELDQTTTTRNLAVLEDSGLVMRVAHHDPRVKLLKLTAKGKQKRQIALEHWQVVQEQVKSTLSEDEWTTFTNALEKMETLCKQLECQL